MYDRYKRTRNIDYLDAAIRFMKDSKESGAEESALPLAHYLRERYDRRGKLEDLELSISMWWRTVELFPNSEHFRDHSQLHNFGCCLQRRFDCLGKIDDLEHAILVHRRADELTPETHPRKASRLDNLGHCLQKRFKRLGSLDDLQSAIALHLRAVRLCPDGHPEEAARRNSLGLSFRRRFDRLGNLEDLEQAIRMHQRAIDITSVSSSRMSICLDDLALCLRRRFDRLGDLDDLERAITSQTRAIDLTRSDVACGRARMDNLGLCLKRRFDHLGDLADLERAIAAHKYAVESSPDGYPAAPTLLSNLASSLHTRFDHLNEPGDLEGAIAAHRRAVELIPRGHPDVSNILSKLSLSLHSRFLCLRELGDLEHAIAAQFRSLSLTADDHPDMASRLSNLGLALQSRFDALGQSHDLRSAISVLQVSIDMTPDDHPGKLIALANLGHSWWKCFLNERTLHGRAYGSFRNSIDSLLKATAKPLGSPQMRLTIATFCVQIMSAFRQNEPGSSRVLSPLTEMLAHSRIIGVIPELVWLGHSVTRRLEESQRLGGLVNDAVSFAISFGTLPQAIEWLETGRALVWSQISSLRTPMRDLERSHPRRALALKFVLQRLQRSSGNISISSTSSSPAGSSDTNLDNEATLSSDHHRAVLQYERLLRDIRLCSGFENFMRPERFTDFTCIETPVVFINVSENGCDAVICDPLKVFRVALPLRERQAKQLRSDWRKFLLDCGARRQRASFQLPEHEMQQESYFACFARVLESLWSCVVFPIFRAMRLVSVKTCNVAISLHGRYCNR